MQIGFLLSRQDLGFILLLDMQMKVSRQAQLGKYDF
jgi:hypothetical protein